MKMTESRLRATIRAQLSEMMFDLAPAYPRGGALTPEEEVLSAIATRPGGEAFLARVGAAIRAQRGLDRTDPEAVKGFLLAAAANDKMSAGELKESEPARAYLMDKLAQQRWSSRAAWTNVAGMAGAGALGALLWSWAAKTGTPIDQLVTALSHLTLIAGLGAAGAEAHDAISAGRDADEIERILRNKPKAPVKPGPLKSR